MPSGDDVVQRTCSQGHHPPGDGLFYVQNYEPRTEPRTREPCRSRIKENRAPSARRRRGASTPTRSCCPAGASKRCSTRSQAGAASYGVLPIENSIGGSIHRNYDLLLEHDLPIVGEVELPVVHHLLALPGRDARRPAARLLASAGAGAVRALSAHADRRRDHRHLRHRRQRQDGRRRGLKDAARDRLGARRRGVRPASRSPSSVQDFDDNITRFLVIGRRRCRTASPTRPRSCSRCRTSRARCSRR